MDVLQFIDENFKNTIHHNTGDNGTLIGLPFPYTVPCAEDTFLEMYYWDTYFTNVGLLVHGMAQQAKNNVDNMLYLVEKYGFMPNGNRTYYLNRSQPPFLFAMVRDVFDYFGDAEWLKGAYKTLCIEYEFWETKRKAPNGLNFYGDFDGFTEERIAKLNDDFKKRTAFETDDAQLRLGIAETVMTFVESGWDCNSRFGFDGRYYNPVDLNSLLYGFETAMAYFSTVISAGEDELWSKRAEKRKNLMREFLWNEQNGIYMDWNFKKECFSSVCSAASLYPLFVKLCDDLKGEEMLLNNLLLPYGVAGSKRENCMFSLQWDYPNIWAPLQYVAFAACMNYGLYSLAEIIAERYIKLIEDNFGKTGNLWEKYDGVTGEVASQDYKAPKMLGWTAGVYLYFKKFKGE